MGGVGRSVCTVALLCLAGAGAILDAPRQAGAAVARIGWLSSGAAGPGDSDSNFDALKTGLGELGYVVDRDVRFEKRWASGEAGRLPGLAAELVRLKVNLICVAGTPAALAAKGATTEIPIVFANVAFPDESGLVASYARPGANITGVAFVGPEYGKRLELLKEAVPKLRRVALLYNAENRASVLAVGETQRWAKSLDVGIETFSVREAGGVKGALDAAARARPDGLMTTADVFILASRAPIVEFATKARIPSMIPDREYVEIGGLMFYGSSIADMYRHAATYVDRILKGAKPAGMPVEQPRKFDMVINRATAKALGLKLPQSLLLRADVLID